MASFHDRVVAALDFSKAEKVSADDIAAAYNKVHGEMVQEFHSVQGVLTGDVQSLDDKIKQTVQRAYADLGPAVQSEASAHPWAFTAAGLLAGLIAGLVVGSTFLAPLVH